MNPSYVVLNVLRMAQREVSEAYKKEGTNFLHWIWTILTPLDVLQKEFRTFAMLLRNKAQTNSQSGLLEIMLNNVFDYGLRRIVLNNYTLNNPVPVPYHFEIFIPQNLAQGTPQDVQDFVLQFALHDKLFKITVV